MRSISNESGIAACVFAAVLFGALDGLVRRKWRFRCPMASRPCGIWIKLIATQRRRGSGFASMASAWQPAHCANEK